MVEETEKKKKSLVCFQLAYKASCLCPYTFRPPIEAVIRELKNCKGTSN